MVLPILNLRSLSAAGLLLLAAFNSAAFAKEQLNCQAYAAVAVGFVSRSAFRRLCGQYRAEVEIMLDYDIAIDPGIRRYFLVSRVDDSQVRPNEPLQSQPQPTNPPSRARDSYR